MSSDIYEKENLKKKEKEIIYQRNPPFVPRSVCTRYLGIIPGYHHLSNTKRAKSYAVLKSKDQSKARNPRLPAAVATLHLELAEAQV